MLTGIKKTEEQDSIPYVLALLEHGPHVVGVPEQALTVSRGADPAIDYDLDLTVVPAGVADILAGRA
jgi:hypothetical protein